MAEETNEVPKRRITAQQIADRLVKLHGEKIVAIFLYGSAARGDCGPYSDVEMLVFTKTPLQIKENYLVLDDVLYAIYCHTLEEAFKHLKQANKDLAIHPNVYLQAQALYDPQNLLDKLREAVQKLSEEQHREAACRSLHDLYEYYGKLRNAYARKDLINAIYALDVMLEHAAFLVALINRERFPTENNYYIQHTKFKRLPRGYQHFVDKVRLNRVQDLEEAFSIGQELWGALTEFAGEHGIQLNVYRFVDEWSAELEAQARCC